MYNLDVVIVIDKPSAPGSQTSFRNKQSDPPVSTSPGEPVYFKRTKFDEDSAPDAIGFGSIDDSNHTATLAQKTSETTIMNIPDNPRFEEVRAKWHDLVADEGGFEIIDTAKRAVSMDQLEKINSHINRRFAAGERWFLTFDKSTLETAAQANLYHMNDHVIKPATIRSEEEPDKGWSLVEFMASGEQIPDYFISHWCKYFTSTHSSLVNSDQVVHRGKSSK